MANTLPMHPRFYGLAALVLMGMVDMLNALPERCRAEVELKRECLEILAGLSQEENA